MAGNARRTRKNAPRAARRNRSRGQGRAVSRQAPIASVSLPTGNTVPAPREEARPEQTPIPSEEGQPGRSPVPAQASSAENDPGDFLQFSITRTGDARSYSLRGFKGASKAICRLILCFGVTAGLTAASIIYVLHVLVPGPMREKVYSGVGIVTATMIVLIGSWAKHRLGEQVKRRLRKRRSEKSENDVGLG
jgi:hypothetical protein